MNSARILEVEQLVDFKLDEITEKIWNATKDDNKTDMLAILLNNMSFRVKNEIINELVNINVFD